MPHIAEKRYAVVSCHVERPLDDRCWLLFSRLQERRPGGFRIAALMRPPDPAVGEDEARWLERARTAAARGPLGHHTHFGGVQRARPATAGPEAAERVRREAAWLRDTGLSPRLFCGGGWYIDADVGAALAELGYADCTATAFPPSYLGREAPRLTLGEPAWLTLDGNRILELPSTHSLGMAARAAAAPAPLGPFVHVYFHDTDLLARGRRLALEAALLLLGLRRHAADLDRLADEARQIDIPERSFAEVATG